MLRAMAKRKCRMLAITLIIIEVPGNINASDQRRLKMVGFQALAELLPGRKSLENNAKRALMERQAIEILKITKTW